MKLEALRREYLHGGLRRADLAADPFHQFDKWMQQAIDMQVSDPTAMTVATVAADGRPSQRIVLLKQADQDGFVFYTNYSSRKAQELAANPRVSLHFPWHAVDRQVKIGGWAEKISAAESAAYFDSRPRDSQLAALASRQSEVIDTRESLLQSFAAAAEKHDKKVPMPDYWGGYRVQPDEFEFWQGGGKRLHDRFRYLLQQDGSWRIDRLAP